MYVNTVILLRMHQRSVGDAVILQHSLHAHDEHWDHSQTL
jgi:hypothetical protein